MKLSPHFGCQPQWLEQLSQKKRKKWHTCNSQQHRALFSVSFFQTMHASTAPILSRQDGRLILTDRLDSSFSFLSSTKLVVNAYEKATSQWLIQTWTCTNGTWKKGCVNVNEKHHWQENLELTSFLLQTRESWTCELGVWLQEKAHRLDTRVTWSPAGDVHSHGGVCSWRMIPSRLLRCHIPLLHSHWSPLSRRRSQTLALDTFSLIHCSERQNVSAPPCFERGRRREIRQQSLSQPN